MPKVAIFFSIVLFSFVLTNSYAFTTGDLFFEENTSDQINFNSDILKIDSDFFTENDYKRYLIFGTNSQKTDFLKNNSIYGIQSNSGFFYISTLTEKSASFLVSQGFTVVEDSKLDFHISDDVISDASRIGEITGSDNVKKKYDASGNGTVIAIVDTGVDFSNLDIQHSLARDKFNHPVMLDPDGQGIVLTNATFFAYIDDNDIIRNYSKPIPSHMTSSVYVSKDGVFLDLLPLPPWNKSRKTPSFET